MSSATSMYTRSITDQEWAALLQQFPMGTVPPVSPILYSFVMALHIPGQAEAHLNELAHRIFTCSCWHCSVLRNRQEITMYDVWLRLLLYCNGQLEHHLN